MTIRFSIFAGRLVLACAALAGLWSAPASAQTPAAGLPIAEGAWVDVAEPCGRAINGHVYAGYRWGDFSQWGDGQVGAGADPITSLARVEGGFIRINGGPIEVKPLPDGRAIVRAFSLADGEIWRTTVRRCTPETLAPQFRAAVNRALAQPAAPAVYIPGEGTGRWQMAGTAPNLFAIYAGSGRIEMLALGCDADGTVNINLRLRGETRVAQTRLAVEYVDGNTASYTAIFYSRDHDMWGGKADEGIIDTLDQESAIVLNLGPEGSERIPLAGSSAAIRPALAACWRTQR